MKKIILLFLFFLSIFYINNTFAEYIQKSNFGTPFITIPLQNIGTGSNGGYFLKSSNYNENIDLYSHTGQLVKTFILPNQNYINDGFNILETNKFYHLIFDTGYPHVPIVGGGYYRNIDYHTHILSINKFNGQSNISDIGHQVNQTFCTDSCNTLHPYYVTSNQIKFFGSAGSIGNYTNIEDNFFLKLNNGDFKYFYNNDYTGEFYFTGLTQNPGFSITDDGLLIDKIGNSFKYYFSNGVFFKIQADKIFSYNFSVFANDLKKSITETILPLALNSNNYNYKHFAGVKDLDNNLLLTGDDIYLFSFLDTINSTSKILIYNNSKWFVYDGLLRYYNSLFKSEINKISNYGTLTGQINYSFSRFMPNLLTKYVETENKSYVYYMKKDDQNLYVNLLDDNGESQPVNFQILDNTGNITETGSSIIPINSTGTTNSGTTNSGTTNSGTTNSGTTNSGTTNSGTTNSGTTNSGTTNSGTTNSGTTNSGTTNSGTTNSGTTTDSNNNLIDDFGTGFTGSINNDFGTGIIQNTGDYSIGKNSSSLLGGCQTSFLVQTSAGLTYNKNFEFDFGDNYIANAIEGVLKSIISFIYSGLDKLGLSAFFGLFNFYLSDTPNYCVNITTPYLTNEFKFGVKTSSIQLIPITDRLNKNDIDENILGKTIITILITLLSICSYILVIFISLFIVYLMFKIVDYIVGLFGIYKSPTNGNFLSFIFAISYFLLFAGFIFGMFYFIHPLFDLLYIVSVNLNAIYSFLLVSFGDYQLYRNIFNLFFGSFIILGFSKLILNIVSTYLKI